MENKIVLNIKLYFVNVSNSSELAFEHVELYMYILDKTCGI